MLAATVGLIISKCVAGAEPNSLRHEDSSAKIVAHGAQEPELRCEVVDQERINELRAIVSDRFTPDELIDLLDVPTVEVFDRFVDECLEIDWELVL
jgi:hypothetical protein